MRFLCLATFIVALFVIVPVDAEQGATGSVDSSGLPVGDAWVTLDSAHFIFIYRERDRPFVHDLRAAEENVYRTVTGYFKFEPKEKPYVIIGGDRDEPSYAGFCGPLPLRIFLSAAATYSPRTLLSHEFTHWMNAMRPTGLLYGLSTIFGKDLSIVPLAFEFHFMEGLTSYIEGYRSNVFNEMLYKAPILEERMWSFEQAWTGGSSQPGALREYLSGLLITDYLLRHYGPDAFLRLHTRFAKFPFFGDVEAIRYITGMDPRQVWSEAIRESRQRFSADASIPGGALLTPQDSANQYSWSMIGNTARGLLVQKNSLNVPTEFGFLVPDGRGIPATGPSLEGSFPAEQAKNMTSWSPIRGVDPSTFDGLASDQSGRILVAGIVPPSLSGRDDERVVSDLWLMKAEPSPDGQSFVVAPRQLTHGAQISSPTLSADGTQLYAIQRVSHEFRLVKVDVQSGAISVVLDGTTASKTLAAGAERFSVLQASISPDTATLGLLLSRQGDTDVGIVGADGNGLKWITHDPALEYSPYFTAKGSLEFASDRENSMVLYQYNPTDASIQRVIRDPVGVWAGDYVRTTDGSTGFVYQTYTSFGYALKMVAADTMHIETVSNFAGVAPNWAKPRWIINRDAIWDTMAAQSPEAPPQAAGSGVPANGATTADGSGTVPAEKPLVDIAHPTIWFPWLGTYAGSFFGGLELAGTSCLNSNSWTLALGVYPDSVQPTGDLTISIAQPNFSASLDASLQYGESLDQNGALTAWQYRTLNAAVNSTIFAAPLSGNSVAYLSIGASTFAQWSVVHRHSFDFLSALNSAPGLYWSVQPQIQYSVVENSPATAIYGLGGFNAGLAGVFRPLRTAGGPGVLFDLGKQFGIGITSLQFAAHAAWDSLGISSNLLSPGSSSWVVSDRPLRASLGVKWGLPFAFDTETLGDLSIESSGFRFGVSTGSGFDYAGNPTWDGFFVLNAEFDTFPLWAYLPIPVTLGISVRVPGSAGGGLKASDFVFYFGVYSFSATLTPASNLNSPGQFAQDFFGIRDPVGSIR